MKTLQESFLELSIDRLNQGLKDYIFYLRDISAKWIALKRFLKTVHIFVFFVSILYMKTVGFAMCTLFFNSCLIFYNKKSAFNCLVIKQAEKIAQSSHKKFGSV